MFRRAASVVVVVAWLAGSSSPAGAGVVQATGFKMATGATAGYVLTTNADGVGTWQSTTHSHFGAVWSGTDVLGLSITSNSTTAWSAAVRAETTGASGELAALVGLSSSTTGFGLWASATATTGNTYGVYSEDWSGTGIGVYGWNGSTTGSTVGVKGAADSPDGKGVYGKANSTTGSTVGVEGEAASATGEGVHGYATHATGATVGVGGEAPSTAGTGVLGQATAASGQTYGVVGIVSSADGYAGFFQGGKGIYIVGDITASGAKSFVQPHPKDPTKEIVYVALEGREAGTYVRGTAELRDGEAVIELPDDFALVTGTAGLTVQLTPVGQWLQLFTAEQTPSRLVVRETAGRSGRFSYLVQGVRKGFENRQVIRDRSPQPPQVSQATPGGR